MTVERRQADDHAAEEGPVPYWRLVLLIFTFILVPQFISLFVTPNDGVEQNYGSVRAALRGEIVPDALGAVFAVWLIVRHGWVDAVRRERLGVQRWVLIVPVVLLGFSFFGIDFGRLSDVGSGLVAALVIGTLFTGISEELMFRGFVLQATRERHREFRAAIATSLLFGGAHLLNWLVIGGAAGFQAVYAGILGYLLYLCRRVSGGMLLPIVVHWIWDLSSFSADVGLDDPVIGDAAFYAFLAVLGLVVVLTIRRHHIEEPTPAQPSRIGD